MWPYGVYPTSKIVVAANRPFGMYRPMLGSNLWEPPSEDVAEAFELFSRKYDNNYFRNISIVVSDASDSGPIQWRSNEQIADTIIECIRSKTPASFVRLSDGEGNLVGLTQKFGISNNLLNWCAARISYIHFGNHGVILDAKEFFASSVMDAFTRADVIGFAESKSVIDSFDIPKEKIDVRAIVGNRISLLYLYSCVQQNIPIVAANAWFSRGLLPHYGRIIRSAGKICVISTYQELPGRLSSAFSVPIDRFSYIPVPKQAVFVDTRLRENTKHYPDAMNEIISSIQASPGPILYIVAAGLLGKHYCNLIKQMGGIAVDIGSVAEVWLGIQARGMLPAFIERWKL